LLVPLRCVICVLYAVSGTVLCYSLGIALEQTLLSCLKSLSFQKVLTSQTPQMVKPVSEHRLSLLFVCISANRARSGSTSNTGSPSCECHHSSSSQWTGEKSTQETPCFKYPIPVSGSRSPGNVWGKLCPEPVVLYNTQDFSIKMNYRASVAGRWLYSCLLYLDQGFSTCKPHVAQQCVLCSLLTFFINIMLSWMVKNSYLDSE
jgi:hypothetical protein